MDFCGGPERGGDGGRTRESVDEGSVKLRGENRGGEPGTKSGKE